MAISLDVPMKLAYSLLVVLSLLAATASAAADELELNRDVQIAEDSDSFHAVSHSTGYEVNDRFDLLFDEGTLSLWYTQDAGSVSVPGWQLELEFTELFTFADNGDGRFDLGDSPISSYDIIDGDYSVSYATVALPDGGNKTTIVATYADGMLVLVFYVTTDPTYVGTVPISPSEVKLDITISGLEHDGAATHVGLTIEVDVDDESSIELEELDDSAELNLTKSALGGFFRWSDMAMVDGVGNPVGATWSGESLVLSYPIGDTIIHDPILGIQSLAPLSGLVVTGEILGDPLLFGVGAAFATASVLGAVVLRRRKNH